MPSPFRKRYTSAHQRLLGEWRGLDEAPEGLRPARAMEDLIPETLTTLRVRNTYTEEEICSAWTEIVGPDLALHTRPSGLRRGVLSINVAQATVHYSILGMKGVLLQRLQERFGAAHVQDLRFRMGA